jgi:hypothetical protein
MKFSKFEHDKAFGALEIYRNLPHEKQAHFIENARILNEVVFSWAANESIDLKYFKFEDAVTEINQLRGVSCL